MRFPFISLSVFCFVFFLSAKHSILAQSTPERLSLNEGWRFYKYPSFDKADKLIYDERPAITDNTVADKNGLAILDANNLVSFRIEGPGEIVATDNGHPADLTSFASHKRNAFSGLCLVIIKAKKGQSGKIVVTAEGEGLVPAKTELICH